ncbi:hypothetical protein TorRG33x02_042930 [Trema orientale]|uniref:Uncharacterized protein n=1 Tax=Trema orientale TaxID=63057 RepID=A0A2P5FQ00_TREOI|nr:hypothetical protein TorRG33x02_042930 [Trema orientale]
MTPPRYQIIELACPSLTSPSAHVRRVKLGKSVARFYGDETHLNSTKLCLECALTEPYEHGLLPR